VANSSQIVPATVRSLVHSARTTARMPVACGAKNLMRPSGAASDDHVSKIEAVEEFGEPGNLVRLRCDVGLTHN
jgi:hypothetical protein